MIESIDTWDYDTLKSWSNKECREVDMLPVSIQTIHLLLLKINELVEKVNSLEEKLTPTVGTNEVDNGTCVRCGCNSHYYIGGGTYSCTNCGNVLVK